MTREPSIILALDVENLAKAKHFVDKLYPAVKIYKIGVQPFVGFGPEAIKFIRKKGGEVFLDLKFFDIPHAVAQAVRQAVRLRVKMITLHILGDEEMLKTAIKACNEEAKKLKIKPPLLIGVTILTSKEANSSDVLTLARIGLECGLDGVVCSAREAKFLRARLKRKFLIVTPGIRPHSLLTKDDQKRTVTAREAIRAGSDFLVVGRPILEARDPLSVVKELLE